MSYEKNEAPKELGTEPRIVREDIEWSELWLPDSNKHELPRCLLVGDSIAGGYYPEVAKSLAGRAYVGIFKTSKSIGDSAYIAELALVLSQDEFDLVHINNGMHGWGYSEEEYERDFPKALEAIRQQVPSAQIIWATTTPVRFAGQLEQFDARTERVKIRNSTAAGIAGKSNIPINNLYQVGEAGPDYYSGDGVHFNEAGSSLLAAKVSQAIAQALSKSKTV